MSDFDLTPPVSSASRPAVGASPIADLSYRNYDGPLHSRAIRWWTVALANIRIVRRKPGFWILALFAALPYVFTILSLYFSRGMSSPFGGSAQKINYAMHHFTALQGQQFFIFLMSLLVGTSSIAADNRANALLVYLSKPITKGDYLLGKWMGIFLILYGVCLVPALALYTYCAFSYSGEGFFKDAPMLILRLALACAVPAVVHTSLLIGFSAWSKTPRIAGAMYASVYLVVGIIMQIVGGLQFKKHPDLSNQIQHASISGAIEGLAQNIYNVTLEIVRVQRRNPDFTPVKIEPPSLWLALGLTVGLVVIGVAAARAKIKAVEVVRG